MSACATTLGIMGVVDSRVRRVLVYRLGSLGDMLIALPSLRLVRRAFPAAEVQLLTNCPVNRKAPAAADVFEGSGLVNGYISYPVGTRRPGELLHLWWRLVRWRPEVVVYLAAARGIAAAERDRRFFRLCGVRCFVGVPSTPALQGNAYGFEPDSAVGLHLSAQGRLEPEAERLARTLAPLGDAHLHEAASWDLVLSEREQRAADQAIGPERRGRPLLAVSLGTKVQAKHWGEENWRGLLEAMARRFPQYGLLLVGAADEREESERAAAGWRHGGGGPVFNLCGRLTPRETAAALRRAQLFVGHDSGPMHLAAAVQTRCVAIFAARNVPRQWFPWGSSHRVVYHRVDCMGCGLETCVEQQKKCLLSIGIDEVLREVAAALSNKVPVDASGSESAMMGAQPAALLLQSF